ncbi:hypothetical protein BXY66_1279 [Shimia isoporae]|uniref:Outer membrane beta-barrel porin/alpha-amylase n=1 Tax=Shimia isoporae TaxID=647720 RepID=A0A4R1NLS9_9RHOB|nr:hypothetical protein [Shimia isoporae]TCL09234.1 hypothetical protein BXY66_1279 [Shimia isoporae]
MTVYKRLAASILVVLGAFGSAHAQVGPNIEELAKELANPGAANATMNFKLEHRSFDGTLPGADDQSSTTLTFQPVLPFVLGNGNNLIFRPAFSYVWDQAQPTVGGFNSVNSFGDIPFDLLYSWSDSGWTFGAGVVGAIPTGTDASSDNWLLGPSALAVRTADWGVWGLFPFHNWKVAGDGPATSITSLQYFLFYGLGNGWLIGTGPTMTYNWNAPSGDEWTVPVQLAVSKTTGIGGRVVKLNLSAEKNVVTPDPFSEDWTYTLTVSPVVKNPLQPNPPTPVDAATRARVLAPLKF